MSTESCIRGTIRAGLARRLRALAIGAALALPAAATTPLADSPIAGSGTSSVAGNVVLALSVEFPTAVSVAHLGDFDTTKTYLGIFDPNKCYRYRYDLPPPQMRFDPVGAATNRLCPTVEWSGPVSQWANRWSGNYLNWATMQTIDPFRVVLTGGFRRSDVIQPGGTSLTVLEKAWASGQGGTGNFPDRAVPTSAIVGATPMMHRSLPGSSPGRTRVAGLGNLLRITGSTGNFDAPTMVKTWNPELMLAGCSGAASFPACWTDGPSTVYVLAVRVKVCDADTATAGPLESNCTLYPNGQYKPTGLIQRYSDRLRFAAFGYLNDDNRNGRDAGVLRARMKYVGPQRPGSGGTLEDNPAREWDPHTGIFIRNPDAADAAATQSATGATVLDSGVINYLNKFGSLLMNGYKTFDPVSELHYAALRYLKNQGNVPAWSSMGGADLATRTRWVDGFPVITDWGDPWGSSCQRSAILGIGDQSTHPDRNLPGATGSEEPAKPPEVAADTTIDAIVATNKVGALHGVANYAAQLSPSNLIAGLAYDANTRDQRPDLEGRQTIQTYWMDILEFQWFWGGSSKYYLAGKYGAFEAPEDFDTYGRTTDIPAEWWQSGETVYNHPRPIGYFTAGSADQMATALTRALGDISARVRRFTASLGLALPQLSATGNPSFATTFESERWTGDLLARTLDFDSAGTPTTTQAWSFAEKLGQQSAETGWNGGRRIVTWNPSSLVGIPFRHASLSATQRTNLDTAYRTGDDSADYLNYLRGDRTHETNSTVAGSSKAYRFRTSLVADVLRGRTRVVAKPELPYSDAANPGYAAFKTAQAARTPVAYVAANGGMLHAVDARLSGTGAGKELFAYVPSPTFAGPGATPAVDGLQALGNPAYSHRMYLDSTPVAADVDFNRTASASGSSPDWRTILVGGLGKGGRAYYALDVTNPPTSTTTETNLAQRVLWEFTDPDLGFSYGEPLVFKTAKYGWVVAFASGYNNTTGRGYVFIVNARTGALLKKLDTGAGTPTAQAGLAHLQSFVRDRTDGTADMLYGGDLLGNLWRVDVTDASGNYPAPLKLAQLADGSGAALPVTTRPTVVLQPGYLRRFVTVGTGRLLHANDVAATTIDRFYAILDGTMAKPDTAADLPSGWTYPLTNARLTQVTDPTQSITLDPATRRGWFLELGSAADTGWRVVEEAKSFNGIVAFAAQRSPSQSPCSVAGYDSRVYAIDVGSAQSRLRTVGGVGGVGGAFIPYSTAAEGAVQSLRFVSVAGRAQLVAGSDSGAVVDVPGLFGGDVAPRLISWREIRQ